jgi:hypothetical protein
MNFGIALATAADSWRMAQRAEELGFTHAWFYDTQMLSADCFVAMGRGGSQHTPDPSGHRSSGAIEPHCACYRQCFGIVEQACARPH